MPAHTAQSEPRLLIKVIEGQASFSIEWRVVVGSVTATGRVVDPNTTAYKEFVLLHRFFMRSLTLVPEAYLLDRVNYWYREYTQQRVERFLIFVFPSNKLSPFSDATCQKLCDLFPALAARQSERIQRLQPPVAIISPWDMAAPRIRQRFFSQTGEPPLSPDVPSNVNDADPADMNTSMITL